MVFIFLDSGLLLEVFCPREQGLMEVCYHGFPHWCKVYQADDENYGFRQIL